MSCGLAIVWKNCHSAPKAAMESLAPGLLGAGEVTLVLQSPCEGPVSS